MYFDRNINGNKDGKKTLRAMNELIGEFGFKLNLCFLYMLTKRKPKLILFTGHTMTFNPTDQSLVIIGGYSETRGFNDVVLVQAKHGQGPLRAWHRLDFSAQMDFLKWEIPKLFLFLKFSS